MQRFTKQWRLIESFTKKNDKRSKDNSVLFRIYVKGGQANNKSYNPIEMISKFSIILSIVNRRKHNNKTVLSMVAVANITCAIAVSIRIWNGIEFLMARMFIYWKLYE